VYICDKFYIIYQSYKIELHLNSFFNMILESFKIHPNQDLGLMSHLLSN